MGKRQYHSPCRINLDFNDSYGQFNVLHMNQDGLIR